MNITFKEGVELFWAWFEAESARLHQAIENNRCADLQPETTEAVCRWLADLAWVYGPGELPGEHSFTLSPDGNLHHQFLTDYWLSRSPVLPGWRFYSSRQSSKAHGVIQINGTSFARKEVWVTPRPLADVEKFAITIWHPQFGSIDESTRRHAAFLWLDEVLGEHGTSGWIGPIQMNDKNLRGSMPLEELPGYIKATASARGWEAHVPGKTGSVYRMKETGRKFPRGDVIAGSTLNFGLIQDYLRAEGEMDNPLDQRGAVFVFLEFNAEFLHGEKVAFERGRLEDTIQRKLVALNTGTVLGGAHGTRNAYIDLVLFDGERSLDLLATAAREAGLPVGTHIRHFAASGRVRDRRL